MKSQASSSSAAGTRVAFWDDDTPLVKECLRGEETAWSELLSKYKNLIFSIPIKYRFSQEEAADIFQSVCLDLVHQLASLREPRALAGWLIRVTHNKCIHHMTDKQRYTAKDEDQLDPGTAVEEIPENRLRELEREQLLRTALQALDARCQKLVRMLFFESPARPYNEIAKSLTLATGSIGFIRARCLNKLRRRLEEMGFA